MTRLAPLDPPYDDATAAQLATMMPPGVPPILLFRTFAKNLPMARAMGAWGRYELSRDLSISMREREIVIDRTCAACRCEYEWGVHVAVFAERVGLDAEQLASLTHGSADDPCWSTARERALIRAVDGLHATADLDDDRYAALAAELSEEEILDVLLLCGWYHAISYAANAARVPFEPGAPRFADVRPSRPDPRGPDV